MTATLTTAVAPDTATLNVASSVTNDVDRAHGGSPPPAGYPFVERRQRPRFIEPVSSNAPIEREGNLQLAYRVLKRSLDIALSLALIVAFAPILFTTWLVLMVTTRGRPIFAQQRVGLCGRRFTMYKFRTMRLDAERVRHLVPNEKDGPVFKNRRDPRITRLGRMLRSTSIDELPQLFNILLGDMALVGPRPPIPQEVAKYEAWQRRRLAVKPGLTCLWQVSGRCEIGFVDWVRMDIWYVEHQSLRTDAWLMIRTPLSVLSRRGAY